VIRVLYQDTLCHLVLHFGSEPLCKASSDPSPRPTSDQSSTLSADLRPTLNRPSTNLRPTFDRPSTSSDTPSTDPRRIHDPPSTEPRRILDRPSTDPRPLLWIVFNGRSNRTVRPLEEHPVADCECPRSPHFTTVEARLFGTPSASPSLAGRTSQNQTTVESYTRSWLKSWRLSRRNEWRVNLFMIGSYLGAAHFFWNLHEET